MAANPVEHVPATGTQQRPNFEYYLSTVDDDAEINNARAERNYEIKQKAKEFKRLAKKYGNWFPDRLHNPSKYTNLAAYKGLGQYDEKRNAFHDFLRAQGPRPRRNDSVSSSPRDEIRPASRSNSSSPSNIANAQTDQTGEEAYAHHGELSNAPHAAVPPSPPPPPPPPPPPRSPPTESEIPPPPPPPTAPYNHTISAPPVTYSHTISAPPVTYSHTISSAPVHYAQAEPQKQDNDQPSTRESYDERPAKKPKLSYGARMLAKMGHVEGQGLGKNSDGITTHLEAVRRKGQPKLDDNGDRERINGAQVYDIRGGHRTTKPEESKFGQPSRVVVTWGCCDGVDLAADADRNDGGIRQEMGDVFQAKVCQHDRWYTILH